MKQLNIFLACVFALSLNACKAESPTTSTQDKPAMTSSSPITELQKNDTVVGTGREAEPGFNISVHYTGWLYDAAAKDHKGAKFDSSVDRKEPFKFDLGAGQVIQGWDEGFAGMKIGGKRTLVIPSEMGYGARGAGGVIPPNATLVFDVELLDVK
jgi:FKBP-type peptidyl-prolyl cis-trans isomerase FkpA